MTRKKVKLAFITNDSARKATYKKRKKGLMKKVTELTTLCDIDACAIIYSPYETQPEVWPSHLGVHRVLAYFKTMPEMEQSKKMLNQESFLRQRINKAYEQLKKQKKDNREMEMTRIIFQSITGNNSLQALTLSDLTDLNWVIDQYHKDLQLRIKHIKEEAKKSMKSNGEGSSSTSSVAMKSGEDAEALEQMETMQIQMMQMPTQKQPLFMDLMNALPPPVPQPQPDQHQLMAFTGENMVLPFADHGHSAMWPNPPPAGGFNFN